MGAPSVLIRVLIGGVDTAVPVVAFGAVFVEVLAWKYKRKEITAASRR